MTRPKRKHNSPPQAASRKAIVVLGMHRSGTSALCGALDLLGVDFGKQLMPASDANEKGHWENQAIVRLHDCLLAALGSSWDDAAPLPSDWVEREITHKVRSQLLEILERDFADISLFGIKDPRLCLLVPLWLQIFQTLQIEPYFVLMIRHPWEVAESLLQRDGIEHSKSYLLWLDHLAQAERATLSYKRAFVSYEEMMHDPIAVLGKLRKQLGGNLRAPSPLRASLRDFLDPSLRHHQVNKKSDKLISPVPQLALDFYEAIRNASTSREITKKLELLAAEFSRRRVFFRPRNIRTEKLPPEKISKVSLEVSDPPREISVSAPFWLEAKVTNETNEALSSVAPYPVRLSYHWIERITRQMVVFDGSRSALSPALDPDTTGRYPMKVVAPSQPGEYILQPTLVQEDVCWFENIRPGIMHEVAVEVGAGTDGGTFDSLRTTAQSPQIEQPLRAGVTIGIPIYRGQLFLEESLVSVRNQTYSDIKIILSVDGPDPECEEICRQFLTDSRFRLVIQPDRLGWTAHTNWLMSQVQTEFWHLQEQDDVIEPIFLETLVRYATEHPEIAAAYTDLRTFGTTDTHMEMSSVIGSPIIRQLKLIYEHFSGVAPLGLIRTEALRMSGGLHFNEVESFAADTALMAGLARWGELHRLPLELYRKRVHADSTSATWWEWPIEKQFIAWQVHCLDMLRQALLIDATPQDRRLLWLAVVERLVSPRMAGFFPNIAELTVAERASILDLFLTRARASSIDLPGSLASWDAIESWTKGAFWAR